MVAIPYLLQQFFYRMWQFLERWYIGSFKRISRWAVGFLEFLDKTIALKVTLRHFGEPLFQDYSIIGYIMGFVFRSFRILIGFIAYSLIILFFAGLYFLWAAIPFYILIFRILYV